MPQTDGVGAQPPGEPQPDEWARWDASVESLLALSNEDAHALLDHFSDARAFLHEHFSDAELRRLDFLRWRLSRQAPS